MPWKELHHGGSKEERGQAGPMQAGMKPAPCPHLPPNAAPRGSGWHVPGP